MKNDIAIAIIRKIEFIIGDKELQKPTIKILQIKQTTKIWHHKNIFIVKIFQSMINGFTQYCKQA